MIAFTLQSMLSTKWGVSSVHLLEHKSHFSLFVNQLHLRKVVALTQEKNSFFTLPKSQFVGGAVASWLVRSTPERAVRVRALAGDIVLRSCARHFTLTVPLSTQVYK